MPDMDAVVVGAGGIGLAVARALARRGQSVVVLEREHAVGLHASSRNSEVIHAGIYYPSGSLKAKLCIAGRRQLYTYLQAHGIAHKRCGKLVVATGDGEKAEVERLHRNALDNGVEDLRLLTAAEAQDLEPAVRCASALFSPVTGILDTHQYMLSLLGEAEDAGAKLALNTRFAGADVTADGFSVRAACPEPFALSCRLLVNAAGLWATEAARAIRGLPPEHIRKTFFARGRYFTLRGPSPFRHLVYPVPDPGGLGIHLTLDLMAAARFGPDVEWIDTVDYTVDPSRAAAFAEAVCRYWPAITPERLDPGFAGVRPKLGGPGKVFDFALDGPKTHGVPGLMNLFGIESPGLTASLALADAVADELAV